MKKVIQVILYALNYNTKLSYFPSKNLSAKTSNLSIKISIYFRFHRWLNNIFQFSYNIMHTCTIKIHGFLSPCFIYFLSSWKSSSYKVNRLWLSRYIQAITHTWFPNKITQINYINTVYTDRSYRQYCGLVNIIQLRNIYKYILISQYITSDAIPTDEHYL